MNTITEHFNLAGYAFVKFALRMLVQSSVLIAVLLLAELLLRRRVRAIFRYWMWMLVIVHLISPPVPLAHSILGYLSGGKTASMFTSQSLPQLDAGSVSAMGVASAITWQGIVFLVWLVVVVTAGILLLRRTFLVRQLVSNAKQATWLMKDALEYCGKCVGVKKRVRLKVSTDGMGPAVCGLLCPVVLVPHNLAPTLGARHLRVVLLHELAHIKRGDLWVNLAQTILQIIYFYNPLLWVANSIIRKVREQAVNETVLAAVGENTRWYPDTLGAIAKLSFKPPALSVGWIEKIENRKVSSESAKTPLAN